MHIPVINFLTSIPAATGCGSADAAHVEKSLDLPRSKKRSKNLARELQFLVDNNGKRAKRDQPKCPICQVRIDPAQWDEHYKLELSRLEKVQSDAYEDPLDKSKGKRRGAAVVARQQMERSSGRKKTLSVYEEALEKIQKNRNHRKEALRRIDGSQDQHPSDTLIQDDHSLALSQALLEGGDDVQTCFICNETLHGDLEAINLHIDSCLANMNSTGSSATTPDVTEPSGGSGSNSWDEYEWAGQTRVRATAMMDGGYGGAGFATTSKREEDEDVDEDLDVEDDDADQYGQTQYTERDIYATDETEDVSALREMVSGGGGSGSSARQTTPSVDSPRSGFEETVSDEGWQRSILSSSEQHQVPGSGHSRLVIESLKSRIHQLEVVSRSAPRCLICLEPYKTPLTSIVCWHVHCEQCWLQTLGSKKLCPQCQKITTPADLRRIYL
ncbi:hypothetical protein BDB00DRAFT_798939 [Zychaea mexicana]|uniref:uncharacterized protein n=1 Tax=Zychaea mexicana TaxID=64656 RepID=UPI0022FF34A5|nr:uncharacterized protein BDB00DRAFT_798939 [Zychaea mexicana]KAI9498652.1 hypothetical protein BDB00DRAFT_798939 [Zychaea mexicana]